MLREICDKHGVLLIADEVINGFGRTGKMFAIEHFGIVPDIMTIAKGLSSGYAPIAAAIVRDASSRSSRSRQRTPMGHLLTFGGHPVARRRRSRTSRSSTTRIWSSSGAEIGAYLGARLEELRSHPTVGDVRGVGMLWAVELVTSKSEKGKWGRDHGFTNG